MKRSWLVLIMLAALAALAGVAIAGRQTPVNDMVVPASTTSTTSAPTTTSVFSTTTVPDLDRAAVRIIVANGSNLPGVAGDTTNTLVAAGFTNSQPVDALSTIATTATFYRPGFKDAAEAVAATLGLAASTVKVWPAGPVTGVDASGDVTVALGADFLG